MRVVISEEAERDLETVYVYIGEDNPEAAEHFARATSEALNQLHRHPELGPRPGFPTRHKRLRFWVVSGFHNYLIFYEITKEELKIIRVLHGARDLRRLLGKRQLRDAEGS